MTKERDEGGLANQSINQPGQQRLEDQSDMYQEAGRENEPRPEGNMKKDPDEWKTGDEPMTGAQKSYLKTLSDEAGEAMDESLSKAEASKRIDELQEKTGRGKGGH